MGVITDHLDLWGEALWGTIVLFLGGGIIALVLGLIVGAARVSPVPIARAVGGVYVNWIRNTPLTLVMFFFAFCLPILLGERVNPPASGSGRSRHLHRDVRRRGAASRHQHRARRPGRGGASDRPELRTGHALRRAAAGDALRRPAHDERPHRPHEEHHGGCGLLRRQPGDHPGGIERTGENALAVLLWVMVVFVVLVLLLAWVQRVLENKWRIAR